MRKIPDIVREIIEKDENAYESLRRDILNISSYTKQIHAEVDQITLKEIKHGTIVAALARLGKNLQKLPVSSKPKIKISNLSVISDLSLITYEKNPSSLAKIADLNFSDVFSISDALNEITIIGNDQTVNNLKKKFKSNSKSFASNLVAITLKLSEEIKTLDVYTLLNSLKNKQINILEILRSSNEISFVIEKDSLDQAVKSFNDYF
ncbi:hypothetical protein HY025_01165 [Candidatus Daviesbacteria bacterium]|nr:hypothetical protein [Candidatus Daviesbacteria bacterium]